MHCLLNLVLHFVHTVRQLLLLLSTIQLQSYGSVREFILNVQCLLFTIAPRPPENVIALIVSGF